MLDSHNELTEDTMSKKTLIAIAVLAIIPAFGACTESPLGPEVPQFQQVEAERQPDARKGGHHRGVLW